MVNEVHSFVKRDPLAKKQECEARVRPAADRRRALLATAVRLFADRGPAAVSVADITSGAGMSTGNFYRFFPTKETMLVELRRDALAELRDRASRVVTEARGGDFWAGVDAMVEDLVAFWWEDTARARVVLSGTPEEASKVESDLLALFANGLRLGQQTGHVGDVDPGVAASLVLHGVLGLVYHAIVDGDGTRPAHLVAELKLQLRKLLAP